jgi:hypothetical protein
MKLFVHTEKAENFACMTAVGIEPATFGLLSGSTSTAVRKFLTK